jgi:hypothetical protein
VEVISRFHCRKFPWDISVLDGFKKYFLTVHRRYPSSGQAEEMTEKSLSILQYFDAGEARIRHISACITDPQVIAYSRAGTNLYFFDTRSNIAFFLVKKRIKRSNMMVSIMNGIVFVLSHLLIHNGGILVHGSAVQRDGKTVLFLGHSGAGKSTVTRLCKPDTCFSDDGVVIRKEGERVYAYHSPFSQIKKEKKSKGVVKGEIKKIFLLEKGGHNKVSPVAKNELMYTILDHLIHFYKYLNKETAQMGFHLVKKILDVVPAYKLQFAKGKDVWHDIW